MFKNLISKKLPRLFILSLLLIILDQVSKAIIRNTMPLEGFFSLIDHILKIIHIQNNRGFSFWVPLMPAWTKFLFNLILLFIIIMAFPVYLFYNETRRSSVWTDLAVIGLFAAGSGHLLDNIFANYTVDFIQFFQLPVANLADIYATIGLMALGIELISILRIRKPKWRGFKYFITCQLSNRKEFFDFIKNYVHASAQDKELHL